LSTNASPDINFNADSHIINRTVVLSEETQNEKKIEGVEKLCFPSAPSEIVSGLVTRPQITILASHCSLICSHVTGEKKKKKKKRKKTQQVS